jgi:ERCC4-type nuclease
MSGIPTYWTINYVETARLLITLHNNEQKAPEEHKTLKRVIVPRLQLREAEPFMKALIFLGHAYKLDIGEKKAAALAEKFVNIGDLAMASIEDICCEGIGKQTASKILIALRGQI